MLYEGLLYTFTAILIILDHSSLWHYGIVHYGKTRYCWFSNITTPIVIKKLYTS